MTCNHNRYNYIANLIGIDNYFHDYTWKSSPYITVRLIAVLVTGFHPLSSFIVVYYFLQKIS